MNRKNRIPEILTTAELVGTSKTDGEAARRGNLRAAKFLKLTLIASRNSGGGGNAEKLKS
jgi:hypothetical protein